MQARRCLLGLPHRRQIGSLRQRIRCQNFLAFSTTTSSEIKTPHKKRLDVAIIGAPNAGKSQLLNVLTGAPVSAVSRKRHTTRLAGILGAKTVQTNDTATQLVFVDTPGFLRIKKAKQEGLDRDLVGTATEIQLVDFSLLVVDAARKLTNDLKESLIELMLQALQAQGRVEISDNELHTSKQETVPRNKFAIVLNKVDLVHPKSDLLDIAMEIGSMAEGCLQYQMNPENTQEEMDELEPELVDELMPTFFYVSALKNDGVDDLLDFLLDKATPCESFEVDPDASTSMTPEQVVEEVIREKIYRCLHKEVPYSIRQQNRLFRVVRERETGQLGVVVHQDLMVRTKSHKELVHGSGNRTLERIRETAVRDLQKMLNCPVELRLHVKLVKSKQRNWSI